MDNVFPTVIIGIYIAAVLSAIMPTVDSLLVTASSAITRDFYQKIFQPDLSDESLTEISRWVTLGIALFALDIAMTISVTTPERSIFWFIIFGWSGIAATFCPVIILSLFWENYTERGAIATMITGFLSIPFFKFFMTSLPDIGILFEKLDVMFPLFLLAMLAGYIFSKLGRR